MGQGGKSHLNTPGLEVPYAQISGTPGFGRDIGNSPISSVAICTVIKRRTIYCTFANITDTNRMTLKTKNKLRKRLFLGEKEEVFNQERRFSQ